MSFVDTNVLVQSTATAAPYRAPARAALAKLRAKGPVAISRQIMREYLAVVTRPQVHDANIVATMLTHGETELLTFNEVDFRRFGGLIQIISP